MDVEALIKKIPRMAPAEREALRANVFAEVARRRRAILHEALNMLDASDIEKLYGAAAELFPDLLPDHQPRKDD